MRGAFQRAWGAYERHAFGYDDLKPLSAKGEDWMGMGVTIVDSLDTFLLMGLGGTQHPAPLLLQFQSQKRAESELSKLSKLSFEAKSSAAGRS